MLWFYINLLLVIFLMMGFETYLCLIVQVYLTDVLFSCIVHLIGLMLVNFVLH